MCWAYWKSATLRSTFILVAQSAAQTRYQKQRTMLATGIYEQIINRLFKQKLDQVDTERFYIGKKAISKEDAVNILSKYL